MSTRARQSDVRLDLLRPATLKALCARAGIRPDRRSGQHFLVNARTLERIVAAVDPQPGDTILEIGAGFGVLTLALAEKIGQTQKRGQTLSRKGSDPVSPDPLSPIIAIERDRRITPILRELVMPHGNVEVVEGDVIALLGRGVPMRWSMGSATPKETCGTMSNDETRITNQCPNDEYTKRVIRISDLIRHSPFGLRHSGHDTRLAVGQQWKLAANLPYGITSDFLRLLFDAVGTGALPPPERVVLLLQREVVARLVGVEDRGLLTMLAHLHCAPRLVARVPASHFWPSPRVESAIVALEDWRSPAAIAAILTPSDRAAFLALLRAGFRSPRRQLRTSIRNQESGISSSAEASAKAGNQPDGFDAAFRVAGITPIARPGDLTFAQWVALARAIHAAQSARS